MAHYVWDLGFDCDAVVGKENHSYLQNGFLSLQPTYNAPTNPIGIQPGDVIGFNAFNVTRDASIGDRFIQKATISFSKAVNGQTVESPFVNSDGTPLASISIDHLHADRTSPSVVFSAASDTRFPFFHLVGPLRVSNNGKFLMRIELEVSGAGVAAQTFVVDPEMVIGSVG